ncbi:PP2C family protein-serine/threonine phosphatase [Streptomyces sp. C10-9-1]|uniref:PP2C family protein-serine/threonine phosphatase n=1 Tax=Streptomyces sp. C10-9-1 TaxID=1859285 RepID=UPI003D765809
MALFRKDLGGRVARLRTGVGARTTWLRRGGAARRADRRPGPADRAVDAFGSALDEQTVAEELAAFACPGHCDSAAVHLLTGDRADGPDGPLRRVAERGAAAHPALHAEAAARFLAAPGGPHRARFATLRSGGTPVTCLAEPLTARGQVRGVLTAVRQGRSFTREQTAALHHAARLAALLLGHARAHASTRDTALDLQRALLAEPGRPHPNLDIATRYLPAGGGALVGGDWFETVRLHYGRTLLVVGDVMGHGLDAAVDMNAYRSALRHVAAADLPPHRVLRQLDTMAARSPERRPATCLLVRVDPARGTAAFASAGHLPPVLFAADGRAELVAVPVGPPLGTGIGGYEVLTRAVAEAETLLLFTDGLVERRGVDIDSSLERLSGRWLPPGTGAEALLDAVVDRCGATRAEDDVAVLAARVRDRPAGGDRAPAGN